MREKVHGIIDSRSMYSTDCFVTLEFLAIASEQKHPDVAFRRLFTKSYAYQRRGVPDLLPIMRRIKFLDMSSKLSGALAWELGC